MAVTARILLLALVASCGGTSTSDAHAPTKVGSVMMSSNPGVGTAGASFTDEDTCAPTATVDTCMVLPCRYPPPSTMYSAGTLTITGASIPISLTPGADNVYGTFETEGAIFLGGQLMVSAMGAEVPAFTAAVGAPSGATITSPAPPTAPIAITRSDGFTFSWSGSAGDVRAVIDVPQGPELECWFDAAVGTATIPAAALMMLPASSQAELSFEAADQQEVVAGEWAVSFSAHTRAVWTTGNFANAGATLQ